jgi:hypothetical protein
MITVGILKKMIEGMPDDSQILSGTSDEDLRYITDVGKINLIWKDKEENEVKTTALFLQFSDITTTIAWNMFIPKSSEYSVCDSSRDCVRGLTLKECEREKEFTPSTLVEELGNEDNFLIRRFNIDKNILKMIQLKLIENFDSLTKAYEELLEHKNRCVFGKCLDAIICKE